MTAHKGEQRRLTIAVASGKGGVHKTMDLAACPGDDTVGASTRGVTNDGGDA